MEFLITIVGTIITVIGTGVTIWQAWKVRTYGARIAFDLRKINLSEAAEALRRAQDEGRKLLTHVHQLNRGKNPSEVYDSIQVHIDRAINLLPLHGADADVRVMVVDAQAKLRESQTTQDDATRRDCVSTMHALVQDAISLSKERLVALARDSSDD